MGKFAAPLNADESRTFKDILVKDTLDQDRLLVIVKKAIEINKEYIWGEALAEYNLI